MKKFTEYLDDFSFDDLVVLWNEYASENGWYFSGTLGTGAIWSILTVTEILKVVGTLRTARST